MKVSINNEHAAVQASEMSIGQVGKVAKGYPYTDHLLLRTPRCFVSLSDPDLSWNDQCSLMVHVLPVGTTLTIKLEK